MTRTQLKPKLCAYTEKGKDLLNNPKSLASIIKVKKINQFKDWMKL